LDGSLKVDRLEAKTVVAGENVKAGGDLVGNGLMLNEQVSGKGKIEAGKTEVIINSQAVTNEAKIYVTLRSNSFGKMLYVNKINEEENFEVKFNGEAITKDIEFDWLVVK